MGVTVPQYLVLIGESIPEVGLHRQAAKRPTEDHLAREKVHGGKTLHGNQEKGCEEENETLTVGETIHRKEPRIFTRGLSGEAPPERLFDFSRQSLVVRLQHTQSQSAVLPMHPAEEGNFSPRALAHFELKTLTSDDERLLYGTKWGCSGTRIVLETPYAGILAFLQPCGATSHRRNES